MSHAGGSFLSSSASRALVSLADLTEYYNLGGAPGHDLSYMIERGGVCRELVDARCAQLRLWLDAPDTKRSRKHRKMAKECLSKISEI